MATDSKQAATQSQQHTSAKQAAREVADEARSTARELGHQAVDQTRSTMGYVREQARTSFEEGKNQVAEQVGGVAKAFHRGSEALRDDNLDRLAEQSEWLAGRIEELRGYLQERSVSDLLNDVRGVARSQPALFIGGMFTLGLVAARFLQSSESHDNGMSRHGHRSHDMGSSGAGTP